MAFEVVCEFLVSRDSRIVFRLDMHGILGSDACCFVGLSQRCSFASNARCLFVDEAFWFIVGSGGSFVSGKISCFVVVCHHRFSKFSCSFFASGIDTVVIGQIDPPLINKSYNNA